MADTNTPYIIQSQGSPVFCIGVDAANEGAPVNLMFLQGAGSLNTQWYLDADTGVITSAANPRLCLDVPNAALVPSARLVLSVIVNERPSQSWNWTTQPLIFSNGAPELFVTNSGCAIKTENPIVLDDSSSRQCQMWTLLPVAALQRAGGERLEAAAVGDD
ncbi:MAG TPA: RICIN domain-containing protein [Longimicrobium sp.]|nr:RICIN domain-containing protein [Longimicrobium sp.]